MRKIISMRDPPDRSADQLASRLWRKRALMRKARKVDLAAAMRAHVAATVLMAQHCIDAAASHRPLTLPELRTAEAYWLAFAIRSVRENWSKQGLSPTTSDRQRRN